MTDKLQAKIAGIPLLSKVPAHWSVNTIKRGFEITLGKMLQPEQKSGSDVLAPYLRSVNVRWGSVDVSDVQTMWFSPTELQQLSLVDGDLVVCEGGDAGRASIWRDELALCSFQNSVNRVRSAGGNDPRYLMYWLASIKESGYIDIICNKATIAHLTKDKLSNLPMPYPPAEEQSAIASYLDVETARIDTLIAEKEKLIASVMQLRASTIHDLLNVGLMKGPVKNCSLKHFGQFRAGSGFPISEQGVEGKPLQFFKVKDLSRADKNGYMWSTDSTIDFDTAKQLGAAVFGLGTIVFAKVGAALLLSRFRLLASPCCIDNNMMAFTVDETLCNLRFAWYQMSRLNMTDIANPGTVPSINERQVKDLKFDLPPLPEQSSIVERLDAFTGEIDKLSVHVMKEIELLSELRSTTITDAVLGRIDGRVTAYNQKELEAA